MAVVTVCSLAASGYLYRQVRVLQQDPNRAARQELEAMVAEIAERIVLPEGEAPTVATVSDPEKLQGQAFFANAKTGDKVLIYTTAKKAILYDPESKKVVEVAPISIGNTAGQASTTAAEGSGNASAESGEANAE